MDLSTYVTRLREDLASAAAAGDEQTQRTGALLGAAIEPAARLALMNALADLAAEVTEALGDRVVEVRLDGRDVRVAVSAPDDTADEPEPESARIAVRGLRAAVASRASAAWRRGGRHLPRHAAAGRADQEPGRAGRGQPGHVAQLLGGAGRPGRARGPPARQARPPRRREAATAGRQAREGVGAGMSEPIDFTKDDATVAPTPRIDTELVRRESWPVSGVAELELVGRRRAHRGAPRPGRRAARCRSRCATTRRAGGMWGQGISGVLSWIGQATAAAGRRARRPRRRGRAGRRDHLVGARAAADRALVAGAAAARGAARGHRDRARGLPARRPHRSGRRRS